MVRLAVPMVHAATSNCGRGHLVGYIDSTAFTVRTPYCSGQLCVRECRPQPNRGGTMPELGIGQAQEMALATLSPMLVSDRCGSELALVPRRHYCAAPRSERWLSLPVPPPAALDLW